MKVGATLVDVGWTNFVRIFRDLMVIFLWDFFCGNNCKNFKNESD